MTAAPTVDSRLTTCTDWCVANHAADPACWGKDIHTVPLTVEAWDSAKHNSITPYAYRATPGHIEVVKLHLYRPSDREHLYLDDELVLTADEARALAAHLLSVVEEIGEVGK